MRKIVCVVVTLGLMVGSGISQNNVPARFEIQQLKLVPSGDPIGTSQWVAPAFGAIHCDANSNMYVRVAEPGGHPLQASLLRVSRDGKDLRYIHVAKTPGLEENWHAPLHAIGPEGQAYFLVRQSKKDDKVPSLYLVAFSKDGEYRWSSRFTGVFEPHVFAALPEDLFLISGFDEGSTEELLTRHLTGDMAPIGRRAAFTRIYDASAQVRMGLESAAHDEKPSSDNPTQENAAIQRGDAQVSRDGRVFVLRGSSPPRVEIWLRGRLERTHTLQAPFERAELFDIRVAEGKFMVFFQSPMKVAADGKRMRDLVFVVFDSDTGRPLWHVRPSERAKGWLGCWDWHQHDLFTLITNRDGRFAVLPAKAEAAQ